MDPVTLTAISIGATVIGGGVATAGVLNKGSAEANMYTYQAGVAQMNKQIADQNAEYALAAGDSQAQIAGMQTRAQIGATKAQQGGSGLDVNSGTGVNVRQSEAEIGSANQAMIRANATREAYGYKVQGAQYDAQAGLDQYAAKTSKTAGNISAATSILGTASSVSTKWLDFSKQGIPGYGGSLVS